MLLLPIIIFALCLVHIRRKGNDNVIERLGFLPRPQADKKVLWLHAVSVGEVLALQELVATIKREQPNTWIHLTVGTISGKAIAHKQIAADCISFMPYDLVPCILLAYIRLKPHALIVMEAEIWPALFFIAHLKKIPLFVLNARISKRSAKRMQHLAVLVRQLLRCCTHLLTQSQADTTAFMQLEIPESKITTLGNIKAWNVLAKKTQTAVSHPLPFPVLLAGSIHPSEELIYLKTFMQLKQQYRDLRLILVPRHFNWQHELMAHVTATGASYTVWTEHTTEHNAAKAVEQHDILVVCRLGELFGLYQYATVFFLGGTFVPVEGHNLLEPAAWGIPSIVGPRHANCKDIFDQLESAGAALCALNPSAVTAITQELLQHPKHLQQMQEANMTWIKKEAHRVENAMRLILFRSLFRS